MLKFSTNLHSGPYRWGRFWLFHRLLHLHWSYISTIAMGFSGSRMNSFLWDQRLLHTFCVWFASFVFSFVASIATANYSQVDKLWSITPVVYAAIWVFPALSKSTINSLLMFLLVFVWGCRLTTNFYLRGGYKWPPWLGDEDYRWKIVQKWPVFSYKEQGTFRLKWTWTIFNLFYISAYLNFLLLCLVFPIIYLEINGATAHEGLAFQMNSIKSVFLFFLGLALIAIEGIADHQVNLFQRDKQLGKVTGFRKGGLFNYCRHPNYAAEQMIWVVLYLFTVDVKYLSDIVNWSIIGCLLNISLFYQSTKLTEEISAARYGKSYIDYQRKMPKFFPCLLRRKDE